MKNQRPNDEYDQDYLKEVDLMQLSKNYAFDPRSLKRNFAIKVKELITDSRIRLKLYQLFGFRLRYNGIIKMHDLLFYINKVSLSSRFKEFYEKIISFKPENNHKITISDFLEDEFFSSIPYIRDYFCNSTFPSIFGNFITEESFEDGYNFIKNNFKDINILPFLISSFLNHSTLFQYRLISTFLANAQNYENKSDEGEEDDDKDDIITQNWPFEGISISKCLKIFMNAFQKCISFLSKYQIDIVKDIWKSDKKLAIYIISELFLKDILQSLSKYHSLSDHTNTLTIDNSVINPPNTTYINHLNILSEIYNHLDFTKIIEMICKSPTYFKLARTDELIFNDGCDLVMSISDFKIIELFYHYIGYDGNQPRTIGNSIPKKYISLGQPIEELAQDKFTMESFIISTDYKIHTSTSAPEPKSSSQDERKICYETFLVHQFLLTHSGHLHILQISTDATKSIVNSKILEYVGEVLLKRNVFEPEEYEKSQTISYISKIYKNKLNHARRVNMNDNEIKIAASKIFDNANKEFKYLDPLKLSEILIEKVLEDINSRSEDSQKIIFYKSDPSIFTFSLFLRYLIQVSYRLRIAIFNKEKASIKTENLFNFEPTIQDANKKDYAKVDAIVAKLVNINSLKISKTEYNFNYDGDDVGEFNDDNYFEIKSIIYYSNQAMENDSKFMRSDFNIGQKIQTFVIIEKLISNATKKSDFIMCNKENRRFLFYKILKYTQKNLIKEGLLTGEKIKQDNEDEETFKSRACFYLRANLIKARYFLQKVIEYEKSNHLLMQVELNDANHSLNKLSTYFGLQQEIKILEAEK